MHFLLQINSPSSWLRREPLRNGDPHNSSPARRTAGPQPEFQGLEEAFFLQDLTPSAAQVCQLVHLLYDFFDVKPDFVCQTKTGSSRVQLSFVNLEDFPLPPPPRAPAPRGPSLGGRVRADVHDRQAIALLQPPLEPGWYPDAPPSL